MSASVLWAVLALLVVFLLLTSTINLALRIPSRARLTDVLTKAGREAELKRLVEFLPHLALANGALRAGALVGLVLVVVVLVGRAGATTSLAQYGYSFAGSWALILVFGVAIPNAWSRYAGESLLAVVLPAPAGAPRRAVPVGRPAEDLRRTGPPPDRCAPA